MSAALEKALIETMATRHRLKIAKGEITELEQGANPLQTLSQGIKGTAKRRAELLVQILPTAIKGVVDFLQARRSSLKLCSFSAVSDSIIMWSHYGNNHQGFCIEYDIEQFSSEDAFLKNLYPVIYSHELFDLTPWSERLVTTKREELNPMFPLLGVLQKFKGWEYERDDARNQQERNAGDLRCPMHCCIADADVRAEIRTSS